MMTNDLELIKKASEKANYWFDKKQRAVTSAERYYCERMQIQSTPAPVYKMDKIRFEKRDFKNLSGVIGIDKTGSCKSNEFNGLVLNSTKNVLEWKTFKATPKEKEELEKMIKANTRILGYNI